MAIFFIGFFVYVLIRIILLLQYLLLNKHIWVEINIKRNNQKRGIGLERGDPVLDIDEKDIKSWMDLYRTDVRIKRVATSILLCISLFFGFSYYQKTGSWTNISPVLAGIVTLQCFNALFDWFEIDVPSGMTPVVPARILAKKRPKNFMK